MAISTGGGADTPMSDINTTPLVDVMLVLLITLPQSAVPVAIQTIEITGNSGVANRSNPRIRSRTCCLRSAPPRSRRPQCRGTRFRRRFAPGRMPGFYLQQHHPRGTSEELYDKAFTRLDNIVTRAGGPEAIMREPDLIPQVHIRGDVNAPGGVASQERAIYNVQAAGYPTVGFISNPVDPERLNRGFKRFKE